MQALSRWTAAPLVLLLAGAVPASAADKPLCRLATSEVDGYRGQIELRGASGGQKLAGYLSYRFADSAITVRDMAFAPKVPIKLGLLLDFSVDADESDLGTAGLGQNDITDLRVFVGRLTGTSDAAFNKGSDILKSYKLDFSVTGQGSAGERYTPAPQSRLGANTYSFGGGDIGVARRIAGPLLEAAAADGHQLVSIRFVAGTALLEAEAKVSGYRAAAARLLGGAKSLRERAAKGQCRPVSAS